MEVFVTYLPIDNGIEDSIHPQRIITFFNDFFPILGF